ncbi:MAG: TM0106 family RecB-like putative nuclease [Alphaproteobacteria bacterium]
MRLTATDIYQYYRPSECELRSHLIAAGVQPEPPGAFLELLLKLGKRHEAEHLASFPQALDLASGDIADREHRTIEALRAGYEVIFQPVLRGEIHFGGQAIEVVGEPDFLLKRGETYAVRDCKISRRITERDHPEILRQLNLYGWLYEQTSGDAPESLEVYNGAGTVVPVDYDGGATALADLERIAAIVLSKSPPFSPVGWSKCGHCGYKARCWDAAVAGHDVAIVPGVDQGLVKALRQNSLITYDDLLSHFDEDALAQLRRPWGEGLQKVGKKASAILRNARALATNKELLFSKPVLPSSSNFVMFDLEGLPPQLDDLDKVYLWGTQVFGDKPSEYRAALAGFGESGDKEGWESFLGNAEAIFTQYGDIPFIHWATYERTKLNMYIDRYGDRDGIALRVEANLLDLLPVTQKSIALPLSSYSLKVVERYVGFKRTQEEYGGEWSMARYIEATESEDEKLRHEVIDEICTYNREDLGATWAVLSWLKSRVR